MRILNKESLLRLQRLVRGPKRIPETPSISSGADRWIGKTIHHHPWSTMTIYLDDQTYTDDEGYILSLSMESIEKLTEEEYSRFLAGNLEYEV